LDPVPAARRLALAAAASCPASVAPPAARRAALSPRRSLRAQPTRETLLRKPA